jgi:hypothetical protein
MGHSIDPFAGALRAPEAGEIEAHDTRVGRSVKARRAKRCEVLKLVGPNPTFVSPAAK